MNMQQVMKLLDFSQFSMEDQHVEDQEYDKDLYCRSPSTSQAIVEAEEANIHIGEEANEVENFETDFTQYAEEPLESESDTGAGTESEIVLEASSQGKQLPIGNKIESNMEWRSVSELKAAYFELLRESKVTSFSLFELEKLKFSKDPRFLALASTEQAKKYFDIFLKSYPK